MAKLKISFILLNFIMVVLKQIKDQTGVELTEDKIGKFKNYLGNKS